METDANNDDALKKRLLKQLVVAIVIVAGLLGGLYMIDQMTAPQLPAPIPVAPAPVVAVPLPVATPPDAVPVVANETPPEPAKESLPAVTKVEQGVPEGSGGPQKASSRSRPEQKPLSKPAASRPPLGSPPAAAPTQLSALTATLPMPKPAPTLQTPPPVAATPLHPLSRDAVRNFGVQLGVFSNLANAEDLRAKLLQHGIPTTIEARVQAGPFASRADADAARAKLKQLGYSDTLLIPVKNRNAP